MLAMLNAVYGGVCGNNQPVVLDYVRYSAEGVRIADRTGDIALQAATRTYLTYGHFYCGQLLEAERLADEVIAFASDDPQLGAELAGGSPLMCARGVRLRTIGLMRDPAAALREYPLVRQAAIEAGYPEQALWALGHEIELKCALGKVDGIGALGQTALRLAENLGPTNGIIAAIGYCDALACAEDWCGLLETANDALRLIRDHGATRPREPRLLAHIWIAQLALGNLKAAHAAAKEGVALMREYQNAFYPQGYAVFVRAQLALAELAADITGTLDEYGALLTRTGSLVHEGELHELGARLAEREGQESERVAALARAHDCYTRFGMSAQAARIEGLQALV